MNDHIAGIIAKKLQGTASPEELAEWQLWMDSDPGNPAEYDQMARIWGMSEKALASPSFQTAAAWQKIDQQLKGKQRSLMPPPRITPFVKRFTIAAATIGIFLITWSIWKEAGRGSLQNFTAQSDHQQLTLPDGSEVLLRKGSSLRYETSNPPGSRGVTLEGEAFFNVTPDKDSPFRISTGKTVIKVLGTSFLVNSRNEADEIVVQTGTVSINSRFNDRQELIVNAGEKVLLTTDLVQRSPILDSNYLSWNTGRLHFQSTPLPRVIHEVEHYYNIPIRTDKNLPLEGENIHITARFDRQPISEVLDEIRLTAGLSFRKQGDTVIFYKN